MLVSLHVKNFVLIDDCRTEFHPGLNVVTGETGAGKSILAGALSLLVGERSSTDSARNPERDAVIEAAFELAAKSPQTQTIQRLLEESGVPWEEGNLLITRILSPNGRNRIFLNNTQCLLKLLKELGCLLMDLHGQHEHQSLLQKSSYRPLLDRFGDSGGLLDSYREIYQTWKEIGDRLQALQDDERERLRREDTLRFQVQEIHDAHLRDGEDEEIASRLQVIQHAEKLHEGCADVIQSLNEGDERREPLLDELDRLESVLNAMERMDASIAPLLESWKSASIILRDALRELESYQLSLEFDPGELDRLQERYFLIKSLKNKYGSTIAEILQYLNRSQEELNRIDHLDEERESLQKLERASRDQLIHSGKQLHEHRAKIAKKIARQIAAELKPLGMEFARFEIQTDYRFSASGLDIGEDRPVAFGSDGADEVEFLISTIPDRPAKPLKEVASGGEISRIMLAIKCVFGKADAVPLMVFDEIDVGVGGRTADAVAERLALLSQEKQVLCITHLPQIASRADRNLRVNKQDRNGRLLSDVTVLEGKDREEELARMLGGEDAAASKRFAREMLKNAKKG